ncbi:MAG: energy transducer TonB [Gemmatimonadetes bacterium]|nr:energy transducer TonB [Gemmatimonadota bacterium]MCA9767194.1 energy transducer TonB [Gemmatimonadota bacterium]
MTHRTLGIIAVLLLACQSAPAAEGTFTPAMPIEPQDPIPYPPSLFAAGIEGEVMLYLVVDSSGAVIPDSTRVATASGHAEFDAAALQAAPALRFTPARRGDTAVAAPIQVPIHFTLPDSLRPAAAQ